MYVKLKANSIIIFCITNGVGDCINMSMVNDWSESKMKSICYRIASSQEVETNPCMRYKQGHKELHEPHMRCYYFYFSLHAI